MTELCGAARLALEDAVPEETTTMMTETILIVERVATLLTSPLEAGEEVFGAGPEEEQGEEEEMMIPLGDREDREVRMTRTVPMTRTMKRKMMRTPVKRLSIAKRMKLPGLWKPHSGHVTRGSRLDWKMTR